MNMEKLVNNNQNEKITQTLDMIFGYKEYKIEYEHLKFQNETEVWINLSVKSVVPNQLRWLAEFFKDPVPAVHPENEMWIKVLISTDLSQI